MASRSIFVFIILLSLALVSCRPSGTSRIADGWVTRACRKTTDFRSCVYTLMSSQRITLIRTPRALTKILAKNALSKVDEATGYIEKVFYDQQDMVVKEYLALCLDDYAKAGKKLKQFVKILGSGGDPRLALKLMRKISSLAADCQESFDRKKSQSQVNYRPPRPCPLSRQNKSVQLMAEAVVGLLPYVQMNNNPVAKLVQRIAPFKV